MKLGIYLVPRCIKPRVGDCWNSDDHENLSSLRSPHLSYAEVQNAKSVHYRMDQVNQIISRDSTGSRRHSVRCKKRRIRRSALLRQLLNNKIQLRLHRIRTCIRWLGPLSEAEVLPHGIAAIPGTHDSFDEVPKTRYLNLKQPWVQGTIVSNGIDCIKVEWYFFVRSPLTSITGRSSDVLIPSSNRTFGFRSDMSQSTKSAVSKFLIISPCIISDPLTDHGIGKVVVWVPVVALPADCLIRRDGLWFGRIELPHKIPFGTRGHRCQFRMHPSPRAP